MSIYFIVTLILVAILICYINFGEEKLHKIVINLILSLFCLVWFGFISISLWGNIMLIGSICCLVNDYKRLRDYAIKYFDDKIKMYEEYLFKKGIESESEESMESEEY